ncbi:MAG: AmmeMemoRadiSam system radical SAM enzyme [Verrucomicrobiales bacterium]|nr:AmmeMemoRadiSam system radical SAM enzyme [Verrucomicrobiales bacterium]
MATLAARLDARTKVGVLWHREDGKVRCVACAHRCLLRPGQRGACKVRFHGEDGLRVPHGYVAGLAVDPVEKKPFYHVLPGSEVLTFGMLGCDLRCDYCQNWLTSQVLRDPEAVGRMQAATPEQIVGAAVRSGVRMVVSSYNEPLITAEWAGAIFDEAATAGLPCAMVSNGHATPEVLDFLQPRLTAVKIDLKGFHAGRYRRLGGDLRAIRRTLESVHRRGLWLEVVTLLVPGFNDDPGELRELTRFLAGVSPRIPWHVTAFHPNYRSTASRRTSARQLCAAAELGVEAGLKFVYAGNVPGQVAEWEDTRCPDCGTTVIRRTGFRVTGTRLLEGGVCPKCRCVLPGLWDATGMGRLIRPGLPILNPPPPGVP